jgi:hypothetical protein
MGEFIKITFVDFFLASFDEKAIKGCWKLIKSLHFTQYKFCRKCQQNPAKAPDHHLRLSMDYFFVEKDIKGCKVS